MILCVTPNPAVDRTLVVRNFAQGGVFRPQDHMAVAGGKGINVARAVQNLGSEAMCAGFLGGFSGQLIASLVEQENLQAYWTWLDGRETRTCVILVDPQTTLTTVVNEPGPMLTAADWAQFQQDVQHITADVSLIAFSGSLPPGISPELFTALVTELIASGKQVWVDTSGQALEAVSHLRGVNIKVNDVEAAALVNMPLETSSASEVVVVGQRLVEQTQAAVVITRGSQGAVGVDQTGAWQTSLPNVNIKSGVGSGDSFLAGLLVGIENGDSLSNALAQAAAAGTANALSIGGGQFSRSEFEDILAQIQITSL
jgi:1-phosphofructokinase family hexose kinase